MEIKSERKVKPLNDVTLAKAFTTMFKNMKSGKTIYLAFSNINFYILVFVIGMSVIANIALLDLLIRVPTMVQKAEIPIFATQFILSTAAVVSGLWLFLKGINIATEK